MISKSKRGQLMVLAFLCLALVSVMGCGDAGGRANMRSPVMLLFQSINLGHPLFSDVWHNQYGVIEDVVDVSVIVESLGPEPGEEGDPTDSVYLDVIVEEAKIEFWRTDTGTAVPATFTQKLNMYVKADEAKTFQIIIVRADQKTMIPLYYLNEMTSYGYEPETGLSEIHCTAMITLKGKTISGHSVSAKGYLTVNFANWSDSGQQ